MSDFISKVIKGEDDLQLGGETAQTRVDQVVYVRKNPAPGQYTSIKSAIESIVDASSSKRYIIDVGPGEYIENPMEIPSWVSIKGVEQNSTIIIANDPDSDLITLRSQSNLESFSIRGPINQSAIKFSATTFLGSSRIHDVLFSNQISTLVNCDSDSARGAIVISSPRGTPDLDFDCAFYARSTNNPLVVVITEWVYEDTTLPYSGRVFDGEGADLTFLAQNITTRSLATTGVAARFADGVSVRLIDVSIRGYETSLLVEEVNNPCELAISYISLTDTINPINIQCTNSSGYIVGVWDNNNVTNLSGNSISLVGASPSNSLFVNQREVEIVDSKVIQVRTDPGPNDFTSVKAAIDSITDATETNRYVVEVSPGVFTEDTIVMKPHVSLVGIDRNATIVQVDDPSKFLFVSADNCSVSDLTLIGGTDSSGGIIITGTHAVGGVFFIRNVTFGNSYKIIDMNSSTFAQITCFTCFGANNLDFNTGFDIRGSGVNILSLVSYNMQISSTAVMDSLVNITGTNNRFYAANVAAINGGGQLGNAIQAQNGATISLTDFTIDGPDVGLRVNNVGSGVHMQMAGFNILNSTANSILIEHPDTTGSISGTFSADNVSLDPNALVGLAHSDPDQNTAGFAVTGDILHSDVGQPSIRLSTLIRESIGLGLMSGGVLSKNGSNLIVDVSSGTGFVNDSNNVVQEIEWGTTQLTLAANQIRYVTVNDNSLVQLESNLPSDYSRRIVLGRVVSNDSEVTLVERIPTRIYHYPNRLEQYLREVFRAIFSSGGLVSEGTTAGTINITPAVYYLGATRNTTDGATPLTYIGRYRDGLGGWLEQTPQTIVPNGLYDNNSGTLASVPASQFTKHLLAMSIDQNVQSYMLVISQNTYADLNAAIAADLPQIPPEFSDSVVFTAAIIMQEGVNSIVDTIDIRPRPEFAAASIGGVTDHGGLTGLSDDDHPQYLLADGSRTITGNLNLGDNNITNVGLVDGVDVSTHASRHLPNGDDAITTAAPSDNLTADTTNSEGIQNSLARSDHSHSISTGTPSSLVPDQSNTEGVSPNIARADHVHNLSTDIPVSIGTSNEQGVSTSFSRADHVHNHGNQPGGSLHDVATISTAGFMSATDKYDHDEMVQSREDEKEPTGFVNRTDSVLSFDTITRTLSIQPSSVSFNVYVKGVKRTINSILSEQIPNVSGNYFFFINELGELDHQNFFDVSILSDKAYVAHVYWDAINNILVSFGEERHGITMDNATHGYLHSNLGTRLVNGASINFSENTDGTLDSDMQIALADMMVADEDIQIQISNSTTPSNPFEQILSPIAEIPVYRREGSIWTKDPATVYPLKLGAVRPQFNFEGMSGWETQDASANGNHLVSYIFATTSLSEPIICILGQEEYTSIADADANGDWDSIDFGDLPFQEIKLLYQLIYEVDSNFTNTPKARIAHVKDYRFGIDKGLSAFAFNTDHSNLSGLSNDDHLQYLIRSGIRPMTGNLDLGTNNIINVNQVNGVTVESHATRHLPGGADSLSTAAAVTQIPNQTNSEGTSTSFARADHIHNIPVDVAVELTDNTNAEGVANSFSRSDHTHSHGNRSGGSLHAAVVPSVLDVGGSNGFMTSIDKEKLDEWDAGYLQYSSSVLYSSNSVIFQSLSMGTNESSFPNGYFTKVNATDFRVNFSGIVRVTYRVLGYTSANDRAFDVEVFLNNSPITRSRTRSWSKNVPERTGTASCETKIVVSPNDILQLRVASVEGDIVSVQVGNATMSVEVYRIK